MGVGIAGRRDRSLHRFALGNDELEFAVGFDADAQHGYRAGFDIELDSGAGTGFTVIFLQAANDRFVLRDVQMMRSVVPDQYGIPDKVDRVEFSETAADIQTVKNHHGDTGFDIELAAHRESGRG